MMKITKAQQDHGKQSIEWLADLKDAYQGILYEMMVTNGNNRQGFTLAMDEFYNSLKQTDANGNILTYVGRDGRSYPEWKPTSEQISLIEENLEGYTTAQIKTLAGQRRKVIADYEARKAAELDRFATMDGENNPGSVEYANAEVYKANWLNERLKEVNTEIERIQAKLDKNPANGNLLSILDAKCIQRNRLSKHLNALESTANVC